MRLEKVLTILRGLADERLAEQWDCVGLQVGDPAWRVRGALMCIDLTEQVLEEAIKAKASLIVAYHPLIFAPLERVTPSEAKGRIVLEAARRRVAVYSPHTALDAAQGGVNDWLCDGLGSGIRRPIRVAASGGTAKYKLVAFVPHDYADGLRVALAAAGAGVIGNYTQCSFGISGQGTFRGGQSTNPMRGKRGRLERVAELRIEMVCPADRLGQVVAALREIHPYEEPAFDVYRLESPPSSGQGQGRVVTLNKPVSVATLIQHVKKHLGVDVLDTAVPDGVRQIKRIGVCAGSGGSLLGEAGKIDAFLTGEMRHHDVLGAKERGVMVLLAGHTQTERPYLKVYRKRIVAAGGKGIDWHISKADQPPSRLR